MTTKSSPVQKLKVQAEKIAALLKDADRGAPMSIGHAKKIAAARNNPTFKTGVVMDDKVLTIEMSWELIRETDEAALVEYIVLQMQEAVVQ